MIRKADKKERQTAIEAIVRQSGITNQEDLIGLLSEQGFEVTQATLSRDFREMKIAKIPDAEGNYVYQLPGVRLFENTREKQDALCPFVRKGVLNIEFTEQMAVVKTPIGYAQGIAYDIDANNLPGVAATVAASDTVMIIMRSNASRQKLINSLRILFSGDNR